MHHTDQAAHAALAARRASQSRQAYRGPHVFAICAWIVCIAVAVGMVLRGAL